MSINHGGVCIRPDFAKKTPYRELTYSCTVIITLIEAQLIF